MDDYVFLQSFKSKIEDKDAKDEPVITEKPATADEAKVEKPELEFTIPAWFLESNVRSSDELRKLEREVVLVKAGEEKKSSEDAGNADEKSEVSSEPEKEESLDGAEKTDSISDPKEVNDETNGKDKDQDQPLKFPEDRFEELKDIVLDSIRLEDGKLPDKQSSVLICAKSDQFPNPTNAIVSHLAAEIEANLIKVDLEDLQDLALEFDIQEIKHEKEHGKADEKKGEKIEENTKDIAEEKAPEANADAQKVDAAAALPPPTPPPPAVDVVVPSHEVRNYDDTCGMCGLAAFYFGVKKPSHATAEATERCKRAMTAVFGSLEQKKLEAASNAEKDSKIDIESKDAETPVVEPSTTETKKTDGATGGTTDKKETATSSGASSGITFVHLSDYNGIDHCLDARRYITRLREEVDRRRKESEKIVLIISVRTDRAPFQFDNGRTSAGTALWNDVTCSTLVEKRMKCSAASTFHTSSLSVPATEDKVNKKDPFAFVFSWPPFGVQRPDGEDREHNMRWIKRVLRHNIRVVSEIEVLKPAFSWNKELTEKTLKYLDNAAWTYADYQRVLRQLRHRVTDKADLPLADIVSVLERMQRNAAAQHDKDEDKDNSEFKNKLDKIKADCNNFEEDLISSVIDPATIKNGYNEVIIDEETKTNVKQLVSLSRIKTDKASDHLIQPLRMTGCMFFGPPGTGKTHLARAIAKDSGSAMLAIDPATMQSKWVGETEKYIQAAFSLAAKLHPCVIFIDEVDALFYRRSSCDKSWERSALTQFLQEMDGLATSGKCPFVVVATNRPSDLDEAFIRRLPHKVSFALPNLQQRVKILQTFLKEGDLDEEISVENLAEQATNMSGSDLRTLCSQAVLAWAAEQFKVMDADKKEEEEETPAKVLLKAHHFAKAFTRT